MIFFTKLYRRKYIIYNYIKLIRLKHWLKNFLLFFPIFFAGKLFNSQKLIYTIIAFFSISFISSAGYIFNNFFDAKFDKYDLKKINRNPIASGNFPFSFVVISFLCFLSLGFFIGFKIGNTFNVFLLLYLLNSILYTLFFKNLFILDLISISFGFVIRLILGGIAAKVNISYWLIILVITVSLILGSGKRLEEIKSEVKGKKVLKFYNEKSLKISLITFSIISWILFLCYLEIKYKFSIILATLSLVLLINYLINVFRKNIGEPTDFLTSNLLNIIFLFLWFFYFYIKIYK